MCNRIVVIMLALIYLCGCQSSDPYVRRSELRSQSKQIAQTSLAVTELDKNVSTTVDRLASSIEQNAESISALESKLDTLVAQNAKTLSELASDSQTAISRHDNSIKQNTESVSTLESRVNDLVKQSTQSAADVGTRLGQLEEQVSGFRVNIEEELSRQEAQRSEATGQLVEKTDLLAEKVNLLDDRLQKVIIRQAEPVRPGPEQAAVDSRSAMLAARCSPGPMDDRESSIEYRASRIQLPHQPYFAVIGPLVIVSGPMVAELYAQRQKKLARSLTRKVVQIPTS